jgi:hypothetical protein
LVVQLNFTVVAPRRPAKHRDLGLKILESPHQIAGVVT